MENKYLSLMSLALAVESQVNGFNTPIKYEPTPIVSQKHKGQLFIFEGIEIYALNQKNARRKFKNLKTKL